MTRRSAAGNSASVRRRGAVGLGLAGLALVLASAGRTSAAATAPVFTPPVRVDDPKISTGVSEPATAVDKNNVRYVAYQSGSQVAASFDGGRTWTNRGGKNALLKNLTGCTPELDFGDVDLTTDTAGRTYFAHLQAGVSTVSTDTGLQAVIAHSDDTFQNYAGVCSSHQPFSVDREWMAAYTPPGQSADNSRVYVTYHDFAPNTMWVNVSKDGGKTFSLPTDVITAPTAALNSFCDTVPAGVAVDPRNGWVYVAWTAGSSGATNVATGCNYTQGTVFNHFFVAVSKDEGATWTSTDAYAGPAVTDPEPADMSEIFGSIAVDTAGGVHIAFPDFLNGEFSAYVASSPPASASNALAFGAPVKVNTTDVHTAYFTRLVAGDPGRLDLIYLGSPVKNVIATAANKLAYTGADPALPNCTPEVGADPNSPHGVRFPGKPCQMPATAPWYLYFAQTLDNGASWTNQKMRDDAMHTGDICTLGIFCLGGDNRDLADVNDVKVDASGAAQVAYTDESADGSRQEIDFQCQTDGPGVFANVALVSCLNAVVTLPTTSTTLAAASGSSTSPLPATGVDPRWALAGVALLAAALALAKLRSA